MPSWTRADFEADKERYKAELQRLLDSGLPEGHPLVVRQQKRIETVDRILTAPAHARALGLVD